MDSDSIKERCLANMWLFFSENLAIEALYNILTQPPMHPFRKAFLDQIMPGCAKDFGDFSVRLNTDHNGKATSLEILAEKQVIFIEPKFFRSAQECIANRTAILKKNTLLLSEGLCVSSRYGIDKRKLKRPTNARPLPIILLKFALFAGQKSSEFLQDCEENPNDQPKIKKQLLNLRTLLEKSVRDAERD